MTTLDDLKLLIIEQLGIEDKSTVIPSASFIDDLGADSLDLVELIMALEEKFEVKIPDEDADKLVTIQSVIDYLRGRGIIE